MTTFTATLAAARRLRRAADAAEVAARAGDVAALQQACDDAERITWEGAQAGGSDVVLSRYGERLWETLEQLWP